MGEEGEQWLVFRPGNEIILVLSKCPKCGHNQVLFITIDGVSGLCEQCGFVESY